MTPEEILKSGLTLLESKGKDYTAGDNQFENFERAALIASWFTRDEDKPFAILIGTKLARIAALRAKEGEPNHESLEDSFTDLTNYSALFGGSATRTK